MITFCINFELSTKWIWVNINDHFYLSRHLLPAIAIYPTQQNWKCLHTRNRQYTEFGISTFLESSVPWEKTSIFLVRYVNEKNLICVQVIATISKFGPQVFEAYFCLLFLSFNLIIQFLPKCYIKNSWKISEVREKSGKMKVAILFESCYILGWDFIVTYVFGSILWI